MYTQHTYLARATEQTQREMMQKSRLNESFFSMKGYDPRPTSVATEIVDTEWEEEEDDIVSEIEDEEPDSPRISLNSSGQPSFTTLSSYEEALTPRSSRAREAFPTFDCDPPKPIQGPRGPHLFRSSASSSQTAHYQNILSLSPLTPKAPNSLDSAFVYATAQEALPRAAARNTPFQFVNQKSSPQNLALWSPEQVAQSMLDAGVDVQIAEKFVENDINGAILITLKFEDLKELQIPSFGVRTKIWEEIHRLRDSKEVSPMPDTPIEDEEDKEVRRERKRAEKAQRQEDAPQQQTGHKGSKSAKRPSHEDIISPMESVSIVGIEQMMPKPHHCSKGENCSKWRRQQRMIEAFKNDHPFIDTDKGGIVMVAGDPGNPGHARALNKASSTEALRPFSDAQGSLVASSDVLGPGMPPLQYLQEATLRNLQMRDPQDNVRQFLDFQHQQGDETTSSGEVPPTPPFEIYPATRPAHEGLRALPKLSIPGQQQQPRRQSPRSSQQMQVQPPSRPATVQPSQQQQEQEQQPFVPRRMSRAEALSPDLQTPSGAVPYRFGTPFSDMDVPVTSVPLGPVARDASQSVPPDMNYRGAGPTPRAQSRASSRRPSFAVMAPLAENVAQTPVARHNPSLSGSGASITPPRPSPPRSSSTRPQDQPLRAPPRTMYPWSSATSLSTTNTGRNSGSSHSSSSSIGGSNSSISSGTTAATTPPQQQSHQFQPQPPSMPSKASALLTGGQTRDAEGISYQGPVRKRKTRMLRHEWHSQYATLKGTRLALHRDAASRDRTLEYIDVDDYAIACSSMNTTSKLNAAFKAMNISRSSDDKKSKRRSAGDEDDVAAFSFQLIPQDGGREGWRKLKKGGRESISGPAGGASGASSEEPGQEGALNGTGKTHHFAVKHRDDRIDWMRELMLARALKQKGEGFEVSVNGNMI